MPFGRGQVLADTDWHIERLYDGLLPGATTVRATFHRYVIDANRGADDASLYPGQNTTGLVPLTDFDGEPIWITEPDADDIAHRKHQFHGPYHAALADEIARVRARHGVAILYDCHSIRSHIRSCSKARFPISTSAPTAAPPAIRGSRARFTIFAPRPGAAMC